MICNYNIDIIIVVLQPLEKCLTCEMEVPVEKLVEHIKHCHSR